MKLLHLFQLPYTATGAAGVLGLPAVGLVDLAFAPEEDCVTTLVQIMAGKGAVEAAFKRNAA